MNNFWKDWFTERDGKSWCIARTLGSLAFVELSAQFGRLPLDQIAPGIQPFCFGVSTLIGAIALKNMSEKD